MTTATASPTEKVEKPTIPPSSRVSKDLWQRFCFERGRGRGQTEAAELTLDAFHIGAPVQREPLTARLRRQEEVYGLAQTPEEQEDEIEREAAEAEAIEAAHAAENPPAGTIPAIRADAQRQVVELEAQRSRLAPEALTDADVKAELLAVESELQEAQKALETADLADTEVARRERQAVLDAKELARVKALTEARELQPERIRAVEKADKAAKAYVEALVACRSVCDRQAAALSHAGYSGIDVSRRRYHTDRASWGLCHYLLAAGGSDLLGLDEEPAQRHKPLAETEPSPV